MLADDPYGRVACETLVDTGLVVVSGEISTSTYVDIQEIARETIRKIGYIDADLGFSADSCAVLNAIDKQSPLVAQHFDMRPGSFRDELDLHRPIYQNTAAYGHFGREEPDFTWERTGKAEALRTAAGL